MNGKLQEATTGASGHHAIGRWFAGRANRKEYWLWVGPIFLILFGWGAFQLPGGTAVSVMGGLPIFFLWIRRLHDLGFTGWIAPLINIVIRVSGFAFGAIVGKDAASILSLLLSVVAIVVLGAWPGQPHDNRYGAPKARRASLADTFG